MDLSFLRPVIEVKFQPKKLGLKKVAHTSYLFLLSRFRDPRVG